jgi:LCP family protein required for cell wall assembly
MTTGAATAAHDIAQVLIRLSRDDALGAVLPRRHHDGRSMATEEKPYKLYRGGRKKGKVPLQGTRPAAPPPRAPGAKGRRWWLWGVLTVVGLLVLAVVWGLLGFRAFSNGVDEANARLARGAKAQLARRDRSILSEPTTLLVIGTDGGRAPGRGDANRSDSMLLVHLSPETHRIAYLSIPRDLQVEIPGYGTSKINAANQIGGPALTLATVKRLTGLPIDHVVVVDFDGFEELIDAIGGIEVNVPKAILSNTFDCPYKPARCDEWKGWRFAKGQQHMDGRRALVYSRIRTNQLDPSDSDITRGNRQQIVADAVGDEIASFGTFLRLPFMGEELAAPLATDLSAWELAQIGWIRFRASSSLRCRLGGTPSSLGGESVLLGSEDNVGVISMWLGNSAPLAPPRGDLYGAGCTRAG